MLYIISGFGGSLLSALFIQSSISVGASGALFGLLGSMLSELITNWTIYANKVQTTKFLYNLPITQTVLLSIVMLILISHLQLAALLTLLFIIVLNLALGLLPHVDNFAHIGGFISGFLLGFIFLIRPQFGWVNQRKVRAGHIPASVKSKHKTYQYMLWVISLILLSAG